MVSDQEKDQLLEKAQASLEASIIIIKDALLENARLIGVINTMLELSRKQQRLISDYSQALHDLRAADASTDEIEKPEPNRWMN